MTKNMLICQQFTYSKLKKNYFKPTSKRIYAILAAQDIKTRDCVTENINFTTIKTKKQLYYCGCFKDNKGGGPRVVVSTAAFHARVRGSVPGLGGLKETKMFLPHPRVKVSIVGSLRDREIACSASDRQYAKFEPCVWRAVSSHSSHHPREVLLAQFSLYVHKGGLKPDSLHFISFQRQYLAARTTAASKLIVTSAAAVTAAAISCSCNCSNSEKKR